MDNLVQALGKYVISAILIILGLIFLIKYLGGDAIESQPATMLLSAILLIGVGIVAIPDILTAIPQKMYRFLLLIAVVLSAFLAYQVWYSVDEEIEFQAKREAINETVVQRLIDIRDAQIAYNEVYGKFTNNFDTLRAFINAPVIPVPYKMGSFHDTLPEIASLEKGYVIKRADIDSIAQTQGLNADELNELIGKNESVYKVRDTLYTTFYES
jgi:Ca2+/Na+ antiporter